MCGYALSVPRIGDHPTNSTRQSPLVSSASHNVRVGLFISELWSY